MILDDFPELRQLDRAKRVELATELLDDVLASEVTIAPELLDAILERVAYNEAHPEECFTSEEVTARLALVKRKIAARRVHA